MTLNNTQRKRIDKAIRHAETLNNKRRANTNEKARTSHSGLYVRFVRG